MLRLSQSHITAIGAAGLMVYSLTKQDWGQAAQALATLLVALGWHAAEARASILEHRQNQTAQWLALAFQSPQNASNRKGWGPHDERS